MNELQVFNNEMFGNVRVLLQGNEPWFVAKDVADTLGYQNGSRDVNRHTDEEDRTKTMVFDGNQNKETILINESGLYSLVLSSKLPNAKQFRRWVTSDVLPSLRKYGTYSTDIPKTLPDALKAYANEIESHNKTKALLEEQKPKVLFADAVNASHTSILVGDLAKLLRQNGLDIGQNRLFEKLRQEGYLIKQKGESYNMPTQRSMDMKLFEVKESTFTNPDGSTHITKTSKVTGKGQIYFANRYLSEVQ